MTAIIYPHPLPVPFVQIEMGQDEKSNGTGMRLMNGVLGYYMRMGDYYTPSRGIMGIIGSLREC